MGFVKGQSGNPAGRKPLPEEVRAARAMSYEDMCRTVIEVREMTMKELAEIDMDEMPLGKRAIVNAYAKMDYRGIKEYEDRLWGKAQESVQVDLPEGVRIEFVNRTRDDSLRATSTSS